MTVQLYVYSECPYCNKVRAAFEEMGVDFEEVNAERGTPGSDELVRLGGRQQVPFLVHDDKVMYESNDIIEYAREHLSAH